MFLSLKKLAAYAALAFSMAATPLAAQERQRPRTIEDAAGERIIYGANNEYVVVLSISRAGYDALLQQESVRGKQGEALVAAILSADVKNIDQMWRFKNGLLNDGPNGEPARLGWYRGQPHLVAHYKDGYNNDGSNGEPAWTLWDMDGKLALIKHYKNGWENDGSKGEPAHRLFDSNGRLRQVFCYQDGIRTKGYWTPEESAQYLAQQKKQPTPVCSSFRKP